MAKRSKPAATKADVIRALQIDGLTAEDAVDRVLEAITIALVNGQAVVIRGFGRFEPRQRKAVVRRNPVSGLDMHVPPRRTVGFVPSDSLKARVNAD